MNFKDYTLYLSAGKRKRWISWNSVRFCLLIPHITSLPYWVRRELMSRVSDVIINYHFFCFFICMHCAVSHSPSLNCYCFPSLKQRLYCKVFLPHSLRTGINSGKNRWSKDPRHDYTITDRLNSSLSEWMKDFIFRTSTQTKNRSRDAETAKKRDRWTKQCILLKKGVGVSTAIFIPTPFNSLPQLI